MQQIFKVLICFILCTGYAMNSDARIRCGSNLISVGDSAMDVMIILRGCGELLYKEQVQQNIDGAFKARTDYHNNYSETNGNFDANVKILEKWYIRVREGRSGFYCYPLLFESGNLIQVGSYADCN